MPAIRPIVKAPIPKGLPQKTRKGKGFSLEELKQAGIDVATARKLGIPVDKRRRTCHPENVELLKQFLEPYFKKKEEEEKEKKEEEMKAKEEKPEKKVRRRRRKKAEKPSEQAEAEVKEESRSE